MSIPNPLNAVIHTPFDYSGLTLDVADRINIITDSIRDRQRAAIVDIGLDLIEAKRLIGHGNFAKWLNAEFGWTARTAENYIRVATTFGDRVKYETVSYLPASVIYQLAARSTPQAIVDEVLTASSEGRRADASGIKRMISAERKKERRKEDTRRRKNPTPADTARTEREQRQQDREAEKFAAEDAQRKKTAAQVVAMIRTAMGDDFAEVQRLVVGMGYWGGSLLTAAIAAPQTEGDAE